MTRPRHTARDLAQIAIFAGLIAALGLPGGIQIGSSSIMITFQTLGVMLCGAILGARKGFLAVLLFDVLVAAGLPLLSGGRGGITWFTTAPSAGYPWGFLVAALFIGFFTEKILPSYPLWLAFVITAVGGMVLVYAVGVPVTALNTKLTLGGAFLDSLKFWPGDTLKVIVTVLVASQVHRAYPGLLAPARSQTPRGTSSPDPAEKNERV